MFNIDGGYLEGLCRGFKCGILKQSDYLNLVQCETLEGKLRKYFNIFWWSDKFRQSCSPWRIAELVETMTHCTMNHSFLLLNIDKISVKFSIRIHHMIQLFINNKPLNRTYFINFRFEASSSRHRLWTVSGERALSSRRIRHRRQIAWKVGHRVPTHEKPC